MATSDWDFAFVAERRADRGANDVDVAANVAVGLYDRLTTALRTDAVDVVDLSRASAVMRFRAARDGVVLTAAVTCTDASPGSALAAIPASRPRDVATATPLRFSLASWPIPSPGSITASDLRCIEAVPGAWDTFCIEAATFWCDAGPVIERAQQEFLDGLGVAGRPAVSRGPA